MREPIVTLVRFEQAANRLQIIRGVEDAAQQLFVRITKRFKVWHLTYVHGTSLRIADRGPT